MFSLQRECLQLEDAISIVDHLRFLEDRSSELLEVIVHGVIVHVIVSIFCIIKLDHERMCVAMLEQPIKSLEQVVSFWRNILQCLQASYLCPQSGT